MKSPRMFRPLLVLGLLEILIAAVLWFMNTQWHTSTPAILVFILLLLMGVVAVVWDLVAFANELKDLGKRPPKP